MAAGVQGSSTVSAGSSAGTTGTGKTAATANSSTSGSGSTTAIGTSGITGASSASGQPKVEEKQKITPTAPNPANTIQVPKPKVEEQPKPSTQNPQATVDNPLLKVRYHRVENGETLYSISRKYEVTVESLKLLNRLPNNNIAVGRVLKIR